MPAVHIKTIRVEADSIDVHGHVNNQEYLRWMQEAAIEHSARQGWPMERYLALGASWYVKSHFIDYLRPALLADEILVCTWVAGMDRRIWPRKTVFLRRADRQMLARAETRWVFVNLASERPQVVPAALRAAFTTVDCENAALEEAFQGTAPEKTENPSSGFLCLP
ncbi:MAG: acyl-CoA thioesterase [Candidatus Accumulibacter sp.]|jgi:acyl-CoA thioester hydrolase|nr:acyl-CoA thioesterase [Accumulibacter sp.]